MAQKLVDLDGIGLVVLAKRRGTKRLKLSVSHSGRVRVGMPSWLPYEAGVRFARHHRGWIIEKLSSRQKLRFSDGMAIGKSHRLVYLRRPDLGDKVSTRLTGNQLIVSSGLTPDHPIAAASLQKAYERTLRQQAEDVLPSRVADIAARQGYTYKGLRIRKLTTRWGSCSSQQVVTLSYLLMQLPWPMIDYVITHELVHTAHMNHGPTFWRAFESALPGARQIQRRIRQIRPDGLPG